MGASTPPVPYDRVGVKGPKGSKVSVEVNTDVRYRSDFFILRFDTNLIFSIPRFDTDPNFSKLRFDTDLIFTIPRFVTDPSIFDTDG